MERLRLFVGVASEVEFSFSDSCSSWSSSVASFDLRVASTGLEVMVVIPALTRYMAFFSPTNVRMRLKNGGDARSEARSGVALIPLTFTLTIRLWNKDTQCVSSGWARDGASMGDCKGTSSCRICRSNENLGDTDPWVKSQSKFPC